MKCQNDRNYRVYNFLPCRRKDYEISVSLTLQLEVPALSREFLFSFNSRPVLIMFFQSFFVLCKTQIIMCSFSKARKISSRASGKMAEFWKDLSLVSVCVPVHAALCIQFWEPSVKQTMLMERFFDLKVGKKPNAVIADDGLKLLYLWNLLKTCKYKFVCSSSSFLSGRLDGNTDSSCSFSFFAIQEATKQSAAMI